MENKIRISRSTKRIEVNDEGEYIELQLSDNEFVVAFYRLLEDIKGKAEAINMPETDDIAGNIELVEKIVEIERDTKRRVDELFGADTCRKVFGDMLPSLDLFAEFFGAILPYFEEYKQERESKMSKYDPERNGSTL